MWVGSESSDDNKSPYLDNDDHSYDIVSTPLVVEHNTTMAFQNDIEGVPVYRYQFSMAEFRLVIFIQSSMELVDVVDYK